MVFAHTVRLLLGARCEHARLNDLSAEQQRIACELLDRSALNEPAATTESLHEVYSLERFSHVHGQDATALATWLQQWWQRVLALFETSGAEHYSSITRVMVLLAAGAAVAFALTRLLSSKALRRAGAPSAPLRAVGQSLDLPSSHLNRAAALVEQAPRASLRESLLALISWLEQARLASPRRSLTNRELIDDVRTRGAAPSLVSQLAPLLTRFDRTFYSLDEVESAEASRFLAEVSKVVGT